MPPLSDQVLVKIGPIGCRMRNVGCKKILNAESRKSTFGCTFSIV